MISWVSTKNIVDTKCLESGHKAITRPFCDADRLVIVGSRGIVERRMDTACYLLTESLREWPAPHSVRAELVALLIVLTQSARSVVYSRQGRHLCTY